MGPDGQVKSVAAEAFLGRPLVKKPSIDEVVLRYVAAFGPSSAADVSAWSGLAGMREVIDRVGARLRPFRDERGREHLLVVMISGAPPAGTADKTLRTLAQGSYQVTSV